MAEQQGGPSRLRQGVIFAIGVAVIMVLGNTERGRGKGTAAGDAGASAQAVKAPTAPPVKVTARALQAAFDGNEVAAARDYGAGPVQVTGRIAHIKLAADNQPMVLLESGRMINWVALRFDPDQAGVVAALKVGAGFGATCGPASEYEGSPILFDCVPVAVK